MKFLLFLLVCAVGGYYGYEYLTKKSEQTAESTPRLAPAGVFFTKERFSVKTEFGVRGLKAGSELKLINKDDTTARVIDTNGNELDVPLEILTNDLDIRDSVLKKAEQQLPRGPSTDPREVARKERITELRTEIKRQKLRIDELKLSLQRAKEDLDTEKAKGTFASGAPLPDEQAVTRQIEQLKEQIKIAQRKLEDADLAIRKLKLNDQPLPTEAPRPGS